MPTQIIINKHLTPTNAHKNGYKYVGDFKYDPNYLTLDTKDIISLAENEGCQIGKPSSAQDKSYLGLYIPQH